LSAEKYKKPFFELLESELRFRIFSLLNIYPELSFSQISGLLDKNKSTLHPHLQKLIEIGVVKVSREEKVRGNFTRNYYALKLGVFEDLEVIDEGSLEKSIFSVLKNWMKFIVKTIKLFEKYLKILELEENGTKKLKDLIFKHEALSGMYFFSKDQFKRASKLTLEYLREMEKIQSEQVNEEKPYYFLALTLPIKELIENLIMSKN
jgi:predicted transcriptional regulator